MNLLVLLMMLFGFIFPNSSKAINVNLLNHSHSPVYMLTEDTLSKESLPNETLIYSAYYNYVEDPLVSVSPDGTERTGTLIEGINALHMGVGYQASNRFLIGLSSFAGNVWLPTREGRWAMGDTKLMFKYRMTKNYSRDSFAIIPEFELPTGDNELFMSNSGLGVGVKLAYEHDYEFMQLTANLGYMGNKKAKTKNIDYRNRLMMALGVHVPINDKWSAIGEGTTTRTMPFNSSQNPGEFYLGGRYRPNGNISINTGVSLGNLDSFGSSDFRILAGIKFTPKLKNGPYHFKNFFTKKEREIIKRILEIRDEIRFKHASSDLTTEGREALEKIAGLLKDKDVDFSKVVIEGHTNKLGKKKFNLGLSKDRAEEVRKYLLNQGLDDQLFETIGYGESKPKSEEEWAKAKVLNRRVQFKVIK